MADDPRAPREATEEATEDGRSTPPPRDDDERRHRRGHRHRRRHRHGDRKERVLHTRISEQLSDDIRRLADDLRVPASNLVRNVLEEVFAVVENVSDDVGDLFEDFVEEAEAARDRLREAKRQGAGRPSRRRRRRSSEIDVEEELARDERAEAEWAGQGEPNATDPDTADARSPESEASGAHDEGAADASPEPVENPFPDVMGWQPLVLNHAGECGLCGVGLARGRRAFVGVTAQGLSGVTLCRACVGS